MNKSRLLGAVCATIFIITTNSTNAALIDNGDGLIYDTVLKITWAQPDASRTWDDANTWADGLTLGGATEWRLPYISVTAGVGPVANSGVIDCITATELACRDNELGYMFYQNLSGTVDNSILTSGDPDLALFPSLQPDNDAYWTSTEISPATDFAWTFAFNIGRQNIYDKTWNGNVWVVHAGNVSAVPLPAAAWLFVGGLLGLIGMARKKSYS